LKYDDIENTHVCKFVEDLGYQVLATRSWMADPGCHILDAKPQLPHLGYQILDTRSLLSDPGYQIQASRSRLPDPSYQVLDTRTRLSDPGYQDPGYPGCQILDTRW
jgi:hypothetical protein